MTYASVLKAALSLLLAVGFISCAGGPLKGINASGEPVYLGTTQIETTPAFQTYKKSTQTEVAKIFYIITRLRDSGNLSYFHKGGWHNPTDAHRGALWLFRNRYETGQTAAEFFKKHAWRCEDSGQVHLLKYPDGTFQDSYYVLLNELALLESTRQPSPSS